MGFLFTAPKVEEVLQETRRLLKATKATEAAVILRKAEKKNVFHQDFPLLWSKIHAITGNLDARYEALEHYLSFNTTDVTHH